MYHITLYTSLKYTKCSMCSRAWGLGSDSRCIREIQRGSTTKRLGINGPCISKCAYRTRKKRASLLAHRACKVTVNAKLVRVRIAYERENSYSEQYTRTSYRIGGSTCNERGVCTREKPKTDGCVSRGCVRQLLFS